MTREQKFFLQILRDHIHGDTSKRPEDGIDWMIIARYAIEQSVGGIVYAQCKEFLEKQSAAFKFLQQGFYAAVYTAANGEAVLDEMAEKFEEKNISYMPFKGEILKRYYPVPELRTMGDKDVLIHQKDCAPADEIMHELGYDKFVDNHAVWTYLKPNIRLEIHNVMFYEYLANSFDYREYFSHIWETADRIGATLRYEPEPNRHFLYLICHTAKHIINKGMGFRAFLDIVFMSMNEKRLDWKWIRTELKKIKLLGFTRMCFAFCQRWFDVKMPLEAGTLDESFFQEVTAKTFNDGTFGHHNIQNEGAHSAKEMQRSGASYWKTAAALSWKKLFPPYEDMQLIPWYSFVDGRPWLMPAAWIYRWFYTAVHKYKSSKELLVEPFVKRDVIEKRERYLKEWKL